MKSRLMRVSPLFLMGLFIAFACGAQQLQPTPVRNPKWAVPVKLKGVENLHKINDYLYRSAQPTREGMHNLEQLGIQTIINLRYFHDDWDEIKGTHLKYKAHGIMTWDVDDEDVIAVMKIIKNKKNGPFLIHCQHGADRTGTMCAMYRLLFENWSKEEAIDEMKNGGYNYHSIWINLISYIEKVDKTKILKALQ